MITKIEGLGCENFYNLGGGVDVDTRAVSPYPVYSGPSEITLLREVMKTMSKFDIKMQVVDVPLPPEKEAEWRSSIRLLLKVLEEYDQAQSENNEIQEATLERTTT